MKNILKYLENKSHILWDWNGTLLDDVDLCVASISHVLEEHGLEKVTRESYRKIFGFPVAEYYRKLGFDFEKVEFAIVADKFIQKYKELFNQCALHPGAKDFLSLLKEQGKIQCVLSAAHEPELIKQLKEHEVFEYFDHVYGIQDHYAAGKIARGKELLEHLKVDKSKVLMFGDTDHDKEVADALGIELVLFGDGHQHAERLHTLGSKVVGSRHENS